MGARHQQIEGSCHSLGHHCALRLCSMLQVLANIEQAQRQNKLFAALKQGNTALADLRKELTLDDVETLMSESAEHKEYEDRMQQLLGESLTPEEDQAALDELEALEIEETEQAQQELPAVPSVGAPKCLVTSLCSSGQVYVSGAAGTTCTGC